MFDQGFDEEFGLELLSFAASMVTLDYVKAIFKLNQVKILDIKGCSFFKFLNTFDSDATISHNLDFGSFSFTLSFAKYQGSTGRGLT
ncbi:MAG: hypothetical protein B0A82_07435 [Alkalinema sp. CACIAM 70d]|nr:MAG: hypothetical protein B0A82_07435 [Alkalinema sp. CACIAM 70d]